MNAKPISEGKVGAGCGGVGLTLFGSVFFLAGCFFMWFVVISPILEWNSARLWPSAEATILTSKVVTHHDSEGSSYSAEFTYKYSVNGQPYENDQYGFIDWSGGRKSADKKQKQHPVGSKTDCYYDPQDPANSVLNRELGWELLFGLIPLIFILVGGGIMYAGWSGVVGKVVDKHNRLSNQVGDARVAESAGIRSGLASLHHAVDC